MGSPSTASRKDLMFPSADMIATKLIEMAEDSKIYVSENSMLVLMMHDDDEETYTRYANHPSVGGLKGTNS